MTSQDLLIARIRQLSEEEISTLLNATSVMLEKHGAGSKPEASFKDFRVYRIPFPRFPCGQQKSPNDFIRAYY